MGQPARVSEMNHEALLDDFEDLILLGIEDLKLHKNEILRRMESDRTGYRNDIRPAEH